MFPKYGWAVILVGGMSSGKSTALNGKYSGPKSVQAAIGIDGKYLDVDKLKAQYIQLHPEEVLSLSNPQDVRYLHKHINSDLKWKQKIYELATGHNLRTGEKINPRNLTNLIFETVGKDEEGLMNIINLVKPLGYKVKVVWIATPVEIAAKGNARRSRHVDEDDLQKSHIQAYNNLTKIQRNSEVTKYIDEFSIIFTTDCFGKYLTQDNIIDRVVDLDKDSAGFTIPDKYIDYFNTIMKNSKEE